MKKISVLLLALTLCLGCWAISAAAADAPTVYVSISSAGELVAARQAVAVTDSDGDGALTISDALNLAHEALYEGGAAAGYKSSPSDYGISLDMLWGVDNGGSYGYYVNYKSSMSLADPIKEGDNIFVYSYADLDSWSDVYTHFKGDTAELAAGQGLTFRLVSEGYDESWNPVTSPAPGAEIFIDGKATDFVTGSDGSVTLTFDKAGTYLVTAESEALNYTPAACFVTVRSFADTVATKYADEIETVFAAGLMKGTGKGFEPQGEMSRAMLVTVLYRLDGSPAVEGKSSFADVVSGSWYESAVSWAEEKGIVLGYGNGLFGTDDSITCRQLETVMSRYAAMKGADYTADEALSSNAPALREQAAAALAKFITK